MLFPSCKTVKLKWLDELAFISSFLLLTTIRKRELLEKWTSSPVAFQGWQSFFGFVVFVLLLIHPRVRNEVKILDGASLILTLPACVTYAIAVAAGTAALSSLPIPVFLAWTNVCPAVLAFIAKRSKALRSPVTLGSITVFLSIVIIFIVDCTDASRLFYFFLLIHVVVDILQTLYLKRINLQIPDFTFLFYNNVISFITLFPVSVYNATQSHLGFGFVSPCLFTGFLSLAVQIFTFRAKSKNTKFLIILGIAQLLTILVSLYIFEDKLDFWVWSLVGINWSATTFILHSHEDDATKNNQFILVVPHVSKNLYVEKYINYGDMA